MTDLTKHIEQALNSKAKTEWCCPVCDSKGTDILRNMDGSTWCINCKHEGSAQEFTQYIEDPLHASLLKCVEALEEIVSEDAGDSTVQNIVSPALADLRKALEECK